MADPDGVLSTYAEIGCEFVVIPYLTEEYRPGNEKFGEVIEGAKLLGAKAKALGMKLCYHNHDFEFVKLDGESALDILYREVSADLLSTQLDTCWVNVAGVNPSEYVLKYTSRAPIVHLKDFNITGKLPEKLYALIGLNEEEEDKKEEEGSFEFRPAGHGMQDVPAILDASVRAGAGWIVVEQDEPSMGLSRMDSVKTSREYLKSIGW